MNGNSNLFNLASKKCTYLRQSQMYDYITDRVTKLNHSSGQLLVTH